MSDEQSLESRISKLIDAMGECKDTLQSLGLRRPETIEDWACLARVFDLEPDEMTIAEIYDAIMREEEEEIRKTQRAFFRSRIRLAVIHDLKALEDRSHFGLSELLRLSGLPGMSGLIEAVREAGVGQPDEEDRHWRCSRIEAIDVLTVVSRSVDPRISAVAHGSIALLSLDDERENPSFNAKTEE